MDAPSWECNKCLFKQNDAFMVDTHPKSICNRGVCIPCFVDLNLHSVTNDDWNPKIIIGQLLSRNICVDCEEAVPLEKSSCNTDFEIMEIQLLRKIHEKKITLFSMAANIIRNLSEEKILAKK